jgi:hypothetical protein
MNAEIDVRGPSLKYRAKVEAVLEYIFPLTQPFFLFYTQILNVFFGRSQTTINKF